MPFTPFHLGPALAIGLALRKYLHAPTFIVANVILDIEGLFVIFFRQNYPLHGYMHTFFLGLAVGLFLGFVMFYLEGFMQPLYRKLKLETINILKLKSFLLAGVLGAALHVLFDAFLYSDIEPFFPWQVNPLLNSGFSGSLGVYVACVLFGIFGIVYYIALIAYSAYKKKSRK